MEDYYRAIELALLKAKPNSLYNVLAGAPRENLQVVRAILRLLGKPDTLIQHVQDRPGYDRGYALDNGKL